jgi:hypothetical protein
MVEDTMDSNRIFFNDFGHKWYDPENGIRYIYQHKDY